jgi:hypothetical protein
MVKTFFYEGRKETKISFGKFPVMERKIFSFL